MLKAYRHIDDLPVYNFLKILKTEDKRFLLVLDDYFDFPEVDEKELTEIWDEISCQLIDENGINEQSQELFRLQKEIILGRVGMITTGDLSDFGIIKVKEKRLERMMSLGQKKFDFESLIVDMEVFFKVQFDLKKMTVSMLYKYIKKYTNGRKSDNE